MTSKRVPVSALMPVRNGQAYLQASIRNVLANLQSEDQLVVVNDGSNDATGRLLLDAAKLDSRVLVLTTEGIGIAAALNLGIREATHEFLARFDVDDIYPVDRIEKQLQTFDNSMAAVFSDYEFVNEENEGLGIMPSAVTPAATKLSLMSGVRAAHPSVIFRKSACLDVGGYIPSDGPAEDLSLWLRMAKVGKITTVPKVLLRYRLSPHSITIQKRKESQLQRHNLLLRYPLHIVDFQEVVDNLDANLGKYKNLPHLERRAVLLFRDLLIFQKTYGLQNKSNLKIIKSLLISQGIASLQEINLMSNERKLRDQVRGESLC